MIAALIRTLPFALALAAATVAQAGVFDGGIPERPARPAPAPEISAPACLRFASTGRGPALVNLCAVCRRAAVAQSAGSRKPATTRYLVGPRSLIPLTGPKSGTVRIVEDLPCQ